MYFVLKETKYETLPSNYTINDLEGHENKKTALKIAEALQTIAVAKNKNGVFYSVLSQYEYLCEDIDNDILEEIKENDS
jgi:hypothetical protein